MSRRHPEPEEDRPASTGVSGAASTRIESAGGAPAPVPAETPPSAATSAPTPADSGEKPSKAPRQTLAGRVWVALAVAAVLLILVIIFIAENTKSITISFLGAHGHISEALALLLAVVVGVVICLLVGTARILQLSLEVRRQKKAVRQLS